MSSKVFCGFKHFAISSMGVCLLVHSINVYAVDTNDKMASVIKEQFGSQQQMQTYDNLAKAYVPLVLASEEMATPAAQRVLAQARKMSLDQRAIISGGCWDYLNAVFNDANVKRDVLFKGDIRQGPYAQAEQLQVGDWIYYINHGYHDIEHSGLFIGWVDKSENQALILSYAGESRQEPARYKVYDISHVYQIMRPL